MEELYEEFIVYDLENTGERKKLEIKQDNLQLHLNSEQVLIIVREDQKVYKFKSSSANTKRANR